MRLVFVNVESMRTAVPPAPAPSSGGSIVAVAVAVVLVIIIVVVIVIVVILIVFFCVRSKRLSNKGIYSPRHFAEEPGSTRTDTLELKYASPPAPNDDLGSPFSPGALEKEAEALEVSEPPPVVNPPSATPAEGKRQNIVSTNPGNLCEMILLLFFCA